VGWAARQAWSRVAFSETHVWYELDPALPRPHRPLEAGLVLRRGTVTDVSILRKLDTLTPDEARHRIAGGNDWWLVLDGSEPLFSCWIFPARAPVVAAIGGELALADGMSCLEDSLTSAAARGRGIAPAAWGAIADRLAAQGQQRMVTKVTVENAPSRRAVEKLGFQPVALMRFQRLGPLSRTRVRALDPERGHFFAERLDQRDGPGRR